MNTDDGKISFSSGIDLTGLERDLRRAQGGFTDLNRHVQRECTGIDGAIRNIGASIAAAFTVQKAGEFVKKMVEVRGEIESLEKSFEILAGKTQGQKLFADIKNFAVTTPMAMGDLAKGAQTLLSFNVAAENVMPIMRAIGDIAMGDAQKFNSLTLAFAQMQSTGKLMGQDLLQMINAGFNPLSVISEQTGKSIGTLKEEMAAGSISADMITKAFMDATSEGGKFHGMLETQSQGIKGSISNLEGAIEDMFNELGEKSQGVITTSIQNVTSLVQNYEKVGRAIAGMIAVYGTYKVALITLNAIKKASIAINAGWTASELIHYKALLLVEKAQKLLNATMLKNPYILVATAVASLATIIWTLKDRLSAAEKAQKKYNEAKEEALQLEKEHADTIQNLIDKVRDETTAIGERETALLALKDEYPEIFNQYDVEKLKLADLLEIKKKINEEEYKRKREAAKKEYAEFSQTMHWNAKANTPLEKVLQEEIATRNLMREDYTKGSVAEFIAILNEKSNDDLQKILDIALKASEGKGNFQLEGLNVTDSKQINLSTLDRLNITGDNLESIINAINSEISKRNPQKEITYGEDFKKAKSEWETAKKELAEIEKDKDNFTTKQYEDAKKREETARKAYSGLGGDVSGKKDTAITKAESTLDKELKDASKERTALEMELYFQERQNRINLEKDERKRKEEQMKLDHEKELYNLGQQKQQAIDAEIDRQKAIFNARENDKAANDKNYTKKTFSEADIDTTQIDDINSSYSKLFEQLRVMQDEELSELQAEESKAMNEYLAQYGNYLEKRSAITALYKEKIDNAGTEGERKSLTAQMTEELSELDIEANKTTASISRLFGDMSNKTVADMRAIANEAERALAFLISGEWDSAQGLEFGITQETFDILSKSPEELEKIRKGINDIRREADHSEVGFKKMANGLKQIFNAGNDVGKTKKALAEIESGLNDVMQVGSFLSDTFTSLGDAFGNDTLKGIGEGISTAMDVAGSTMQGMQAGAMFGPVGAAIGGAIGLVSSLATSIAKLHDKKKQAEIDETIDKYEDLNSSVDNYGKIAEDSFGSSKKAAIEQQMALKQLQIELLKTAIAQEQQKKNPDDGKIQEWENQITGLESEVDDLGDAAVDAIFGEDIQSAIENFESAITEAWATSGSSAQKAKDVVKKMMKQMISESIKAFIASSGALEQIRLKLEEFLLNDGVISAFEQAIIEGMAEDLANEIDAKYGWADNLFADNASQDSTKKGFQAMSQDSADELNGRFTAMQIDTSNIKSLCDSIHVNTQHLINGLVAVKEHTDEIKNIALSSLDYLETISRNTHELYEMNERLGKIEQNTRNL